MKFDTIKVGDVVYDVRRATGNYRFVAKHCVWSVKILEIDIALRRARISWNGNTPKWVDEYTIKKYRKSPPKD